MAIYGEIIGDGIRAAREATLREIVERDASARAIDIEAPLTALALAPDQLVNVTSPVDGWGLPRRSRRIARLASSVLTHDKRLRLHLEDLHNCARLGLIDHLSSPMGANTYADGAAAVLPHSGGGGFNGAGYFRASEAWAWDAAAARVVRVGPGVMAVEADGLPCERASTNLVIRSAFDSGLTGWTTAGTGVNGSAIAADSTVLLFDPAAGSGLPYSAKLTAGSAHAADLKLSQTLASVAGGSYLSLAFDHLEDSGIALYWFLRRTLDGFYWNGSSFVSGAQFNALPVRSAVRQRPDVVGPIATGASASQFEAGVALPTGGTAGRVAHLFHLQVEARRWSSSRIVTLASTVTREESDYCYANESGRRSFPATRGTLVLKVVPNVSTAKADGSDFYFFSVPYDANNEISARYDGINSTKDRVVLIRKAAGTTTTLAGSATLTEGAAFYLVYRWASVADGELDATYGAAASGQANFDVWAGAAGAVAKIANGSGAIPTESTDSRFQIGGKSGDCLEGRVSIVLVLPRVLSDEEIQRWCS